MEEKELFEELIKIQKFELKMLEELLKPKTLLGKLRKYGTLPIILKIKSQQIHVASLLEKNRIHEKYDNQKREKIPTIICESCVHSKTCNWYINLKKNREPNIYKDWIKNNNCCGYERENSTIDLPICQNCKKTMSINDMTHGQTLNRKYLCIDCKNKKSNKICKNHIWTYGNFDGEISHLRRCINCPRKERYNIHKFTWVKI